MSRWWPKVAGVLLLAAVAGVCALQAAPDDGHVIGIWPVGLATCSLLLTPRRRLPVVGGLIAVIALLTIWLGGRPLDVAVGYSIGIGIECVVVRLVLTEGRDERWTLRRDADLARYLLAAAIAGGIAATSGAVTSMVTGFGDPALVALALGVAHIASQLTLPPFFARLPGHGAIAHPAERTLQWALLLTVTPAVFVPDRLPSLTFLVVPILAWSALRIRPREALAQLVAVLGFAIVMTSAGLGPFASSPDRFDLDPDARGVLLASFGAACALIVVPLLLRVGEHIETAREAAAERDKLDRIVRSATGVAIIGADEDGRITLFNPGAERLLGYTAEEMVGLSTRVLHSDEAVRLKAEELGVPADFGAVAARLMEPDMAGSDIGFLRKDGVERTHSMTLSRIIDDRGRLSGFVSTSEDVTERVAARQTLERALERMQEVDAVKDTFVSSVSHELRTPITSILGYLEMLADGSFGDLSAEQAQALQRVSSNSARLLELIDDLLTLSRLQDSGLDRVERAVDLREVVAAACTVVAPAVETGRLELAVGLPARAVTFVGSREELERVVINLLGNAVKFTPAGGQVEVDLETHGEHAVIRVRDTGIGIPVDEQDLLFTRFFRSSLAQEQAIPGSGLGLSIAAAVVEQYGGTLTAASRPGEGATFEVRLPLAT
ncbi:MAG: PAS domain S-box protein [Actinobacteria bacterium]|nr:PAS domain S-box protein [Actinomycetota bacterium]